jgi:hypothetical protein
LTPTTRGPRSTAERGAASSVGGGDARKDRQGGGRAGVFQVSGFAGGHLCDVEKFAGVSETLATLLF